MSDNDELPTTGDNGPAQPASGDVLMTADDEADDDDGDNESSCSSLSCCPGLRKGTEWTSKEDCLAALTSMQTLNRRILAARTDSKHATRVCKEEGCEFYVCVRRLGVRAAAERQGNWRVTALVGHTCNGGTGCGGRTAAKAARESLAPMMGLGTKPKTLMGLWQARTGGTLSYKEAWTAKNAYLAGVYGSAESAIQRLPAFLDHMAEVDPDTRTQFRPERDPPSSQPKDAPKEEFESCAVLLGAGRRAWEHLPPLLTLDACHLRGAQKGVLLQACAVDAAGHLLPLAAAVDRGEDACAWRTFLSFLKDNLPRASGKTTLLTDRMKGLQAVVEDVYGDSAVHIMCCKHIERNVKTRWGKKWGAKVWVLAKAGSVRAYDGALQALKDESATGEAVALYLDKIRQWFADPFIPEAAVRAYQYTTNPSESANSMLNDERSLHFLGVLDAWRQRVCGKWREREDKFASHAPTALTTRAGKELREAMRQARVTCTARSMGGGAYEVISQSGQYAGTYAVKFVGSECTCSCRAPQLHGLVCKHAAAAAGLANIAPESLASPFWRVSAFRQCYSSPPAAHTMSLTELPIDETILEHKPRRLAGAPKKRRLRGGDEESNRKCSV